MSAFKTHYWFWRKSVVKSPRPQGNHVIWRLRGQFGAFSLIINKNLSEVSETYGNLVLDVWFCVFSNTSVPNTRGWFQKPVLHFQLTIYNYRMPIISPVFWWYIASQSIFEVNHCKSALTTTCEVAKCVFNRKGQVFKPSVHIELCIIRMYIYTTSWISFDLSLCEAEVKA